MTSLVTTDSKKSLCDRQQVLAWLTENVPAPRLQHILRVETLAAELALHHGLDVDRAAWAGLLHDLAKYFPPERLLRMAQEAGLPITDVDEADPHLLHADVSALVARQQFGITDEQVLAAVANHTLGQPDMDALSCVVFLADSLEPGRGQTVELEELRKVAQRNLQEAVWRVCDRTLLWLIDQHRLIHPRMILTRNWAMQVAPAKPKKNEKKSTAKV
ncbi:MAG: bis(5'-nucleosyl)-tetraphosphatase (symmetrical) YqeK [Thermosynechococcus sp. Uc]|uniref:bis(5'-nucleosyl)-tetraphosphatase (symmetrical) YqeK n=1 Tax=Thermosynechococcus sp. Uc TaxID=3034853 RepID=UPI00259D845E|nr:bis(5'-nucleosyl)-tetraphosphatase (symmetrical) YqeK [Thermosynechococcus sp. Uc]MDM7327571.1 bis(5'-nucleosyl)-tetraphosphatase (symmetrical) YqeK [Thermosynechococcus sp. Uc]